MMVMDGAASGSTVLVVEDDSAFRDALGNTLGLSGIDVRVADDGHSAIPLIDDPCIGLVISDVQMTRIDGMALLKKIKSKRPELPVLLMTAFGTIQQAVQAMQEGAADYMLKPFDAELLVTMVARYLDSPSPDFAGAVAVDGASIELLRMARRVAESDVSVMLTGESGAGKEVIARFIHEKSHRAARPYVAVNCAAIPDTMLESMLFGYERGAFTGAHRACPGKFEQAEGGTLLLDEITEMNLGLQAKLLHVLQEREVERLGGRDPIRLDVRILATSNRDLGEAVEDGQFREDLYYRLNVFPIRVPPLRERAQDIVPIAERLLAKVSAEQGRRPPHLSDEACRRLLRHRWPGNVRELENVVQRAILLAPHDAIEGDHLQFDPIDGPAGREPAGVSGCGNRLGAGLRSREYDLIVDALGASGGSRKLTAQRLGISPRTLRYKLAKMRESGVELP